MSILEFNKIEASVRALDLSSLGTEEIKNKIQKMFNVDTPNRHLLQPQIDRVINKYI